MIFMQIAFMAFFSFRSTLKGGGKQDKEAPDEAVIGKFSQRSPSIMPSCGAVSNAPGCWSRAVGDLLREAVGALPSACCTSMCCCLVTFHIMLITHRSHHFGE